MMIVSVALPPNYYPPVPGPGLELAEVYIDATTVHAFRQKITDKVGPRQAAGIVEGTLDRALALIAKAREQSTGNTLTATWVANLNGTGKPGWSKWK